MLLGFVPAILTLLLSLLSPSAHAAGVTFSSSVAALERQQAHISANESVSELDSAGRLTTLSVSSSRVSPSPPAVVSFPTLIAPCVLWWNAFFGTASGADGSVPQSRLRQVTLALDAQPPQLPGKSLRPWDKDDASGWQVVVSVLIWAICVVLVAGYYVESTQAPAVGYRTDCVEESPEDWEFPLLSCTADMPVAAWAMFCPGIRWAETLSYVPAFIPFWSAFSIYLFLQIFIGLSAGILGWILLAMLCTAYRQELRIRFGLREQGGMTYVFDCLLYCCCSCCAIAQEARHVKEARRRGHPAAARLSGVHGIAPGLPSLGLLTARGDPCAPEPMRGM